MKNNIIKKIPVLLAVLIMAISLAACGKAEEAAPTVNPADADYDQLLTLAKTLTDHQDAVVAKNAEIGPAIQDGTMTGEEVLDIYLGWAEESAALYTNISNATWQTEEYADAVELLITAADALSLGDATMYEAASTNDETKLDDSSAYFAAYNEAMDSFLSMLEMQ